VTRKRDLTREKPLEKRKKVHGKIFETRKSIFAVLHREFHQHKLESIINIQRFLQSVSGTGTNRHRHRPARTGLDRAGPAKGQHRPAQVA
jgi:hypothetical protein